MASFDENGKYIKTNWKAGDKITATKLNKIEESIEAVNDNDISRHVEADARLDALEAKDVAHDKELTNIKNTIADNKAAAELGDYEVNSRMQFLEQELNEGITEVNNVASTVDGKIAAADASMNNKISQAEANMQNQVNQGKADMETMVAEVEADLEGLHAKDDELTSQLEHIENKQFVSVKDFGAKGDGTTDDSEYIQNAIDSIMAGVIFIPKGTYKISETIKLKDKISIVGESMRSTTLLMDTNKKMIECIFTGSKEFFSIENIALDGNNVALEGIYLQKTQADSYIEKCLIKNINGIGINFDGWCWCNTIKNSIIENCTDIGLRLAPGSNDITIDDCNFFRCLIGIDIQAGMSLDRNLASEGNRIVNSVFQSIEDTSIMLSVGDNVLGVIDIKNNYFEQVGMLIKARNIDEVTSGVIRTLNYEGNFCYLGTYGISDKTDFIDLSDVKVYYGSIKGNQFKDKIKNCVKLSDTSRYVVMADNDISYVNDVIPLTGGEANYNTVINGGLIHNFYSFNSGLNMNGHEIRNLAIDNGSVRPANPTDKQMFYDTSSTFNKPIYYNSSIGEWVDFYGKGMASITNDVKIDTENELIINELNPNSKGNFLIYVFYRVANDTTNVNINLRFRDGGGNIRVQSLVNEDKVTGAYTITPFMINARGTEEPITIKAKSNIANNVFISTYIQPI